MERLDTRRQLSAPDVEVVLDPTPPKAREIAVAHLGADSDSPLCRQAGDLPHDRRLAGEDCAGDPTFEARDEVLSRGEGDARREDIDSPVGFA